MSESLLFLIPLLPLCCAVANMIFGMRLPRFFAETLAVIGVAGAFLLTLLFWGHAEGEGTRAVLFTWLNSGSVDISFAINFDRLAAPMTLMVTGVATLIHLYAVGYMHDDEDYARFFSLLNLFVFAMLAIILADNLLVLFLGWEGVGLCSYGLIGFWYRKLENAKAGTKAFLVTRVGDVFLGIALLWLFTVTGTLSISAINAQAMQLSPGVVMGIGLLLLLGACGKSAQLPLMTWLADAMAGPTPVSALIHAATMVTAGVYLLCRLFPVVSLSPVAMTAITAIGAVTAIYAATCALAQREIKRVLAYSTMSQVGYMFMAVGAGTVAGAMFHLLTHAFFKAALFMGAGIVIHLAGDENDIFKMGGMTRRGPVEVFWVFLAAAGCLAGLPLTGGFFSKDGILLALFTHPDPTYKAFWLIGVITALLTAFYTFRLVYLVFAGEYRGTGHAHAIPLLMRWPLWPLALLGLVGGLLNLPAFVGGHEVLHHWYENLSGRYVATDHATEWMLVGLAVAIAALGWFVAHWRYRTYKAPLENGLSNFLLRGWYADEIVDRLFVRPFAAMARFCSNGCDRSLFDGTISGFARLFSGWGHLLVQLTTGRITTYLSAFAWGFLVLLGWFLLKLVNGGGALMTTLPQFPWLSLLVFLPVAGALLCLLHGNKRPAECRGLSLATSLAVFGVALYLFICHGQSEGRWLLYEEAGWIEHFNIRYVLALDGIALLMVLLTSFMQLAAVLLGWRVERHVAGFFALLMLLEAGLMGIFLAYDLVLFYLFWEVALIPMFFLISVWGGEQRKQAALKFFLYTLVGSLCMLVAMIALYQINGVQTGSYTFVIGELMQTKLTAVQEGWLFAGFLAAFIVKSPLVPFHTWLTDALTEAPAAGSLDLTGLLLKTGIYGLFRVAFPLFPSATQTFLPILGVLALVGLFHAAWSAYHQDDIKRLLAYSSISHLGIVVLGLAAWHFTAWEGSILLMVTHGITTGALFILVALIRERTGTRSLQELGGLWGQAPCLAFMFLLFSLASLGLPGLANFAGEILVLLGTFKQHPAWAIIALLGVVFAAAYMLRVVQGVVWGPAQTERTMPDLTAREWLMLLPMAVLVVWLGIYPEPFLAPLHGAVEVLLAGGLP